MRALEHEMPDSEPIDITGIHNEDSFIKLSKLQRVFELLNIDNVAESCEQIKTLGFFSSKLGMIAFIRNALHFSGLDLLQRKRASYAKLIKLTVESLDNKAEFLEVFQSHLAFGFRFRADAIIYDCLDMGYLNSDDVIAERTRLLLFTRDRTINGITDDIKTCTNMSEIAVAIRNDDVEAIKEYDPNSRLPESENDIYPLINLHPTLIQYASLCGASNCVRYLISKKADLTLNTIPKTLEDTKIFTLATMAVSGGNVEIINMLIEAGVNFTVDDYKYSILYHHTEIFDQHHELHTYEYFDLSVGYEYIHGMFKCKTAKLQQSFDMSCTNNFHEYVSYILKNHQVYLCTGITYACHFNFTEIVRMIVQIPGIDINQSIVKTFKSFPLLEACNHNNTELVQMILDYPNCDVNNNNGEFALLRAVTAGNIDIVRLLLSVNGIDVNQKSVFWYLITLMYNFDV